MSKIPSADSVVTLSAFVVAGESVVRSAAGVDACIVSVVVWDSSTSSTMLSRAFTKPEKSVESNWAFDQWPFWNFSYPEIPSLQYCQYCNCYWISNTELGDNAYWFVMCNDIVATIFTPLVRLGKIPFRKLPKMAKSSCWPYNNFSFIWLTVVFKNSGRGRWKKYALREEEDQDLRSG